jgi:hypothetical protein
MSRLLPYRRPRPPARSLKEREEIRRFPLEMTGLIRDELLHSGVPQGALGPEVPYPDPQLGPKPLSRALPQAVQRRLGNGQCCHPLPPSRSKRPRRVKDSRAGKLKPAIPI